MKLFSSGIFENISSGFEKLEGSISGLISPKLSIKLSLLFFICSRTNKKGALNFPKDSAINSRAIKAIVASLSSISNLVILDSKFNLLIARLLLLGRTIPKWLNPQVFLLRKPEIFPSCIPIKDDWAPLKLNGLEFAMFKSLKSKCFTESKNQFPYSLEFRICKFSISL